MNSYHWAKRTPDYVPGPKHTDDEIVAEDQPDAEDASPTAQSPDYDPVNYFADGGDDARAWSEPSEEDEDDDVDMEADGDEEEEEHPAPADSVVVCYYSAYLIEGPHYSVVRPEAAWSDAEVPTQSLPLLLPSTSRREEQSWRLPTLGRVYVCRATYGFVASMETLVGRSRHDDPERESWDLSERLGGGSIRRGSDLAAEWLVIRTTVLIRGESGRDERVADKTESYPTKHPAYTDIGYSVLSITGTGGTHYRVGGSSYRDRLLYYSGK
ncbi:hypothetical protein Tco_1457935 [Tanacetum coccineum]